MRAALEEEQTKTQSPPPAKRPAQRKVIQEEFDTKLKEILTPEQFERWQELRGQRPPGRRPPMAPEPGGSGTPTNNPVAPHLRNSWICLNDSLEELPRQGWLVLILIVLPLVLESG